MDKDSILASLTGDQIGGNDNSSKINNTEQDLFGDIAIHEESSMAVPATLGVDAGAPFTPATHPIQRHTQVSVHNESLIGGGQIATLHAQTPTVNSVSAPSVSSIQKNPSCRFVTLQKWATGSIRHT